jgi:acetyl-CoA synthetase
MKYVFDYHEGDIFWCTADVGWVTGHSYIVYGPLANGATTLMFEGVPTYPDAGRFWAVCEKHKVNQFYTAPTAIRALMGQGNEFVTKYDLSDLRCSAPWASRSTPRPGTGTTRSSARGIAPSSTPGGRRRPAAT